MRAIYFSISILFLFIHVTLIGQSWESKIPQAKIDNGSVTFFDMQNAFNEYCEENNVVDGYYVENGKKVKMSGWKRFKRWEYFWEYRVNPTTGAFPQTTAQEKYKEYLNTSSTIKSPAGNWTSLGPNSTAGGYSGIGRFNCIEFRPSDSLVLYAGAPAGGLWKTTDGGSNWTVTTDNNDVLGVSDIAIVQGGTTATDIVYIATGDRDGGSMKTMKGGQDRDNNSIGVLKSFNGGSSWNPTGLSFTTNQKVSLNRLLLDPGNINILYAATNFGLYKSVDAAVSWSYISDLEFIDMEFNPSNSSMVYASTRDGRVYKSVNSGDSWTLKYAVSQGGRVELAVSPNEISWVYAVISFNRNNDSKLHSIAFSDNYGDTFTTVYNGLGENQNLLGSDCNGGSTRGQGNYDLTIACDPTDANTVFVGGINTFKSTDGGTTFDAVNRWSTNFSCGDIQVVHADKHALAFQPGTNNLYECNDGGIYKTIDGGIIWTHINDGIANSQIYRVDVAQTNSGTVICGLQDNGTKSLYNGNWDDVLGGDGMDCMIDFTNEQYQYGETQYGDIFRTFNNWASPTQIVWGGSGTSSWLTPMAMNPQNPSSIYFGNTRLRKSTNYGNNWFSISEYNIYFVRLIEIAPSDTNHIYYARYDKIYHLLDETTPSINISEGLPLNESLITSICIKNNDPLTLWVSMGQYNEHGVYQSIDGGGSWTNISDGLPEIPIMSIVQNKSTIGQPELYAATDLGVYVKVGTDNWQLFNSGLPNVMVNDLAIYYDPNPLNNKIRAATNGRGLWESDLYEPSAIPITDFVADDIIPVVGNIVSLTDLSTNAPTSWSWSISPNTFFYVDGTTATSPNPKVSFNQSGYYTVSLNATNAIGTNSETKSNYILVGTPGLWTGSIDSDWDNSDNWDNLSIPVVGTDVIIPSGTPNSCIIEAGTTANCTNLTIQSGATLTQQGTLFNTSHLNIYGNFFSEGTLNQSSVFAYLYFKGIFATQWNDENEDDVIINSEIVKSLLVNPVTISTNVSVERLSVNSGVLQIGSNQTLTITGDEVLSLNIENGGTLKLGTNQTIDVTGGVYFDDGSKAQISGGSISCTRDFVVKPNASYDIFFDGGSLKMNGTGDQYIHDEDGGSLILNNLTIDKPSGICYLKYANLHLNNNLFIYDGILSCYNGPSAANSYNIQIGGHWLDYTGPTGFEAGSGSVTFNGDYDQNCTAANFNKLEVNKSNGLLVPDSNSVVVCQQYNWTSTGIFIGNDVTFTAHDLLDNGIFGTYILDEGGTINLTNNDSYVDLNAEIIIYGGNFSVYGGTDISYWPYNTNASLSMSGGVLDFHDRGININNTANFSSNITGGTIRTVHGLNCSRTDFTPFGGTFYFYSDVDATLNITSGSLYHVSVNKPLAKRTSLKTTTSVYGKRSLQNAGKATTSMTLSLGNDIDINGDFTIIEGVFETQTFDMYVAGSWSNSEGPTGFHENTNAVIFDGFSDPQIIGGEIFHNVKQEYASPGADLVFDGNVTVLNNCELQYNTFVNADLIVNDSLILTAADALLKVNNTGNATINLLQQGGTLETETGAVLLVIDLIEPAVLGTYTINGGSITLNQDAGSYMDMNADITINDGVLTFNGGNGLSWWAYNHDAALTMSGGIFDFTGTGAYLYNSGSNLQINITGGTIRSAGNFRVANSSFTPSGGTVELYSVSDALVETSNSAYFNHLIIDKSSKKNSVFLPFNFSSRDLKSGIDIKGKSKANAVTLFGNTHITGILDIINGALDLNDKTLSAENDINVLAGGKLSINNASVLQMGDGSNIDVSGGILETLGSIGNQPEITSLSGTGFYSISVFSNGLISAAYTHFQNLDVDGISIQNDGLVDVLNPFNYCRFTNGNGIGVSQYLKIDNVQDLILDGVDFDAHPGGTASYNVVKTFNQGSLTFTNELGDFSGEAFEYDPHGIIHWSPPISLDIKVFMEGPFSQSSGEMTTHLNSAGLIPLSQPFNTMPWFYEGTESVAVIPNLDIVDWLLIEFRDAPDASSANSSTVKGRQAVFLLKNGKIIGLDGSANPFQTPAVTSVTNNLYVVIYHRNHLQVMAANALSESGGVYSHNFTDDINKAHSEGASAHKEISPGVFGMFAGNGNEDDSIDFSDMAYWQPDAGFEGYNDNDYNLDAQVDNSDKNDFWFFNQWEMSQVPY